MPQWKLHTERLIDNTRHLQPSVGTTGAENPLFVSYGAASRGGLLHVLAF